jgi:TatD DNase family protein
MGKNNRNYQRDLPTEESHLLLPRHVTTGGSTPIVDTHTHVALTYETYRRKYPNAQFEDLFSFVRGMYEGRNVGAVVDVWCEAPVRKTWKELADSALTPDGIAEKWGGVEYWFVMGEFYIVLWLVSFIHRVL